MTSIPVEDHSTKRDRWWTGLLFSSLSGYRRSWLRGDLVAGLTVWAVLVPESLAYASIAGVSPVIGLYAAPAALILYAAFGSVAAPRHRSDVGNGCAVRRRCRRPRHGRSRQRPRVHRRARSHDRTVRLARRIVPPRIPRQLHLRARAQGLHHRHGADDHHGSGPQAARHRTSRRRLLRAALGRAQSSRRHARPDPRGGSGVARPRHGARSLAARGAGLTRRRRRRRARRHAVRLGRQGCRHRRTDRQRAPASVRPMGWRPRTTSGPPQRRRG